MPPLISVLLPTRGRPKWLFESMRSLADHALEKRGIEFLLKIDDDDEETLAALHQFQDFPCSVKAWRSPRGGGYADMHLWVNHLASEAQGKWLIIWNDDARMMTSEWDMLVEHSFADDKVWHGVDDVICKVPRLNGELGCTAFFFLNRKVVEILGRFSYIMHCDTWVASIMKFIDSLLFLPMVDVHHMEGKVGEERDAIWHQGNLARSSSECTTRNMDGTRVKLEDAMKLHLYIAERFK